MPKPLREVRAGSAVPAKVMAFLAWFQKNAPAWSPQALVFSVEREPEKRFCGSDFEGSFSVSLPARSYAVFGKGCFTPRCHQEVLLESSLSDERRVKVNLESRLVGVLIWR